MNRHKLSLDLHSISEDMALPYARIFRDSQEAIMVTDRYSRILSVNPAFVAITGYSEEDVVGLTPSLLKSDAQTPDFYVDMWASIHRDGKWQGEIWNRRKSGDLYPEWLSITTLRDENGHITHYIGMFTDITERKQSEENLKYLAHYDSLTGLPNRTLLNELLKEAIAKTKSGGGKLTVFFVDLDRFKMVNDSLGHGAGDKLLRQVAHRLSSAAGKNDSVCRLGGDEFMIVRSEPEGSSGERAFAERIVGEMKKPFQVDGNELYVSASIGICAYPAHGDSFEALVKHADLAMYEAKTQKCGYQFFNSGILDTFQRKLNLENELRRAIDRDQLSMRYQPQVNAENGRMEGMEALMRWTHPTLGEVSPAEFIPIAEETGLITDLGHWAIQRVCAQVAEWRAKAFEVPSVAVNLSAKQFMAPDLVPSFRDIVRRAPCDPKQIVIEITESSSMNDIESVLPVLREFKALGFRIAIDDFGKGYSALGYMKKFPVDILKIDKSFVQELTSDDRSAVITKAIIDMAHGMNLKVVAEGVETNEQLKALQAMSCDIVQGYRIDRPLPPERLESRYLTGANSP